MKKQNKEKIIRDRLFKYGKISRNWVIKNLFYTHLSDAILDLRRAGYEIETTYTEPGRKGDCVYYLTYKGMATGGLAGKLK